MDENIQEPAVNTDVQASDVTESPAVEATDVQDVAPVVEDTTQEEPKARNNAQSRLREVLGDKKQLKAENEQLRQMLEQQAQMPVPDNLTEDQYRALATDAQYAAVEVQNLKRQLAYKDFNNEIDLVEQKFPELNPESDSYNPKLAETLSEVYNEGFIVRDQNGNFVATKKSLNDFTKSVIDAYRTAEVKGAAKTQEALAKQAAEAVVTPDSTKTSDTKDFSELSIEEMEKKLGTLRV